MAAAVSLGRGLGRSLTTNIGPCPVTALAWAGGPSFEEQAEALRYHPLALGFCGARAHNDICSSACGKILLGFFTYNMEQVAISGKCREPIPQTL